MCLISMHSTLENGSDSTFYVMCYCNTKEYSPSCLRMVSYNLNSVVGTGKELPSLSCTQCLPLGSVLLAAPLKAALGMIPLQPLHSRTLLGSQVEASGPGQAMDSKREAGKSCCTHKFELWRTSSRAKGEAGVRK